VSQTLLLFSIYPHLPNFYRKPKNQSCDLTSFRKKIDNTKLNLFFNCHFSDEKFDIVFLQEIWFEKDYDFLANCLKENYYIADYDRVSCGTANEVRIDITESSSTHFIIALYIIQNI
jgi:hypothetical protein